MKTLSEFKLSAVALTISTLMIPTTSFAQDNQDKKEAEDEQYETITVTSNRRSKSLNEVPMAISPTMRKADYNQGHAASLPISEDVPLRDPEPFQDPTGFDRDAAVNPWEAAHFKENGFIVKRGLIDDPSVFEQVDDYLWRNVPRGLIRREDPTSWIDTPDERWSEDDSLKVGMLLEGNWKMRSKEGIGTEPVPGLRCIDCQIDVLRWKNGARFAGWKKSADELLSLLHEPRQHVIGINTHHAVTDDGGWAFIECLSGLVARHPAAGWAQPHKLFTRR